MLQQSEEGNAPEDRADVLGLEACRIWIKRKKGEWRNPGCLDQHREIQREDDMFRQS